MMTGYIRNTYTIVTAIYARLCSYLSNSKCEELLTLYFPLKYSWQTRLCVIHRISQMY